MAANFVEAGGLVSPGGMANTDIVDTDEEEDDEDDVDISTSVCISVANNISHRHKTDIHATIEIPETDNPLIFMTFSPKNTQQQKKQRQHGTSAQKYTYDAIRTKVVSKTKPNQHTKKSYGRIFLSFCQ
jgi:hypothetical protein